MKLIVNMFSVLLAAQSSSCADNGGSPEVTYDTDLDPCGFAEPAAGMIDISTFNDVFHGGIVAQIEARLQSTPNPSFHEVIMEEGDCRYFKAAIGSCSPACEGGDFCTVDGECVAYPALIGGGKLEITGLGDTIKIVPESWSPGLYLGPAGLPGELFLPGDSIGASLAGDDYPALALGAEGVALMDTELTTQGYEMLDGQDAEITWTPGPNPEACVRLVINGFNVAHGAPLDDIIVCEGTDTGSLVVPQAFVEEFPYGETPLLTDGFDWPHSQLTRYTRNSTDTEYGRAELVVSSTTYFQPSHPE